MSGTNGSISTGGRPLDVEVECGCDDVNGDGSLITRYVKVWSVDAAAPGDVPVLLGTYTDYDLGTVYTPSNPIECPSAGGGAGGVAGPDRELLVLCDDNGSFLRRYSITSDGTVTFVDTELDGTTVYPTAGTVVQCAAGGTAEVAPAGEVILYDPAASPGNCTPFVRHYVRDEDGEVVGFVDTDLDGGTYAPAGPPVAQCTPTPAADPVVTVDAEAVLVCAGGVTYERRTLFASDGTSSVEYRDGAGAVVAAPAGPFTLGPCPAAAAVANPPIDSTYQRQTGAGTVTIPAGARSITVTVVAGEPTVSIGGAAASPLPAGGSFTWGVDRGGDAGETLQDAFTFTGAGGTDFVVHTTREI